MRTVDASPSGIAVVGADASVERGQQVEVTVALSPAQTAVLHGRVTDVRPAGENTEVGIALELSVGERIVWVRELFGAAAPSVDGVAEIASVPRPKRNHPRAR